LGESDAFACQRILNGRRNAARCHLTMELTLLGALLPVILLLALGIVVVVAFREIGLSPIVGYLAIGIGLSATGLAQSSEAIAVLAELGVVLLLFDIGLHFSIRRLREQAGNIFGFGPVQVLLGTAGLGLLAMAFGLPPVAALLVGATLSLSSTAVVARIIAERHQQSCPVGLTATAILVFQDLAAIFLLIVATAMGTGAALAPAILMALVKAIAAFAAAMLFARYLVRPLFALVARGRNEEVFTALALFVALATGWLTGTIGLSVTLGAFLGGMMLSDTPYRAIIQSEIKPFRGLLLGFFFISVGLSLDLEALLRSWPAVLAVGLGLIAAKIILNGGASLVFRWSVPGSAQLGFLLAQGSEFAFVIFSLPPIRELIGEERSAIMIAAVALSLAATPTVADAGRSLAGRLRVRQSRRVDAELEPRDFIGPVFIVGMGPRGRAVADALNEFHIDYGAIENDPRRLRLAIADGYRVLFGDLSDPRIWEPMAMADRRISVLTEPTYEQSRGITPVADRFYPDLTRLALVDSPAEAARFGAIGLVPVVDAAEYPGLEAAAVVLKQLAIDPGDIEDWSTRQKRALDERNSNVAQ